MRRSITDITAPSHFSSQSVESLAFQLLFGRHTPSAALQSETQAFHFGTDLSIF